MRRLLAALLCLALPASSFAATLGTGTNVTRRIELPAVPAIAPLSVPQLTHLPALPSLPALTPTKGPVPNVGVAAAAAAAAPVAALATVQAVARAEGDDTKGAAPSVSAQAFDGTGKKLGAGAAVFGGALLPLAGAGHAALHLAPTLGMLGYDVANGLSLAFPLPETYRTFDRASAKGFPWVRAGLGALGTLALGLVNAPMLDKPFWGAMHVFIGLGMVAPFVIGKWLERRGRIGLPYVAPQWAAPPSFTQKAFHRLRHDSALQMTLAIAVPMVALSWALYAAAAAAVPAFIAAHMTAAAAADLLLAIQLAKGALFVAVFAPDAAALVRGKPAHGFSPAFTTIFLASVAAFTVWGVSAAAMAPAGPIRDQYLVHAARNLCETIAASLSLYSLRRAAKKP